jgi:hypothetical protein
MDLKGYFKQIRDLEASLHEKDLVVVSHSTTDGGKPGIMTEVPRLVACQLVVEGRARLATAEEANRFREVAETREAQPVGTPAKARK